MPRTPTIFFNNGEWEKLKKKVEAEGHPSMYAYIKDLIYKELNIGIYTYQKRGARARPA